LLIYWFVFGTIRDRAPVEVNGVETPFFTWLLAGFFMWTFCHQSILKGSNSIYTRLRMLSKMNFPMSVIPNYVIFSNFYIHVLLLHFLRYREFLLCFYVLRLDCFCTCQDYYCH